jgi:hypothetical protein
VARVEEFQAAFGESWREVEEILADWFTFDAAARMGMPEEGLEPPTRGL